MPQFECWRHDLWHRVQGQVATPREAAELFARQYEQEMVEFSILGGDTPVIPVREDGRIDLWHFRVSGDMVPVYTAQSVNPATFSPDDEREIAGYLDTDDEYCDICGQLRPSSECEITLYSIVICPKCGELSDEEQLEGFQRDRDEKGGQS